ncbi:MAG: T9SS type A sorting domain-containing protein [Flavobacteriaceae bacterium]
MKKTLLLFFTLFSFALSAQTTHNLGWANDGSSDNQQITIEVGDTIIWTWGAGTHNLRATSGTESFDSGYFTGAGNTFTYTFNQVGSTNYVCDPHAGNMNGTVTVTSTAGITKNNLLSFDMYPNPVSDILTVQLPTGTEKAEVSIIDYTGRLVSSKTISSNDTSIDVQSISKGIYIIRVATNAKIGVQRFIKK